jgi:ABC-type microcin C transport system duplicated ATPase subunit YejF
MSGAETTLLRARGLRKDYGKGEALVRAVDEVDLDVATGETLAVMGPPVSWLVAAVLGALVVLAALTVIPARMGSRQPVAEVLQAEAA